MDSERWTKVEKKTIGKQGVSVTPGIMADSAGTKGLHTHRGCPERRLYESMVWDNSST